MLAVSLQCSVQAQGTGFVPEGILTGTSHSVNGFSVVNLQPQTLTSSIKDCSSLPPTLPPVQASNSQSQLFTSACLVTLTSSLLCSGLEQRSQNPIVFYFLHAVDSTAWRHPENVFNS